MSLPRMVVLAVLLAGCRTASTSSGPAAAASWRALADEYLEAAFRADPGHAAYLGRHEYDGQIRSFTAEAFRRDVGTLHRFRDRVTAFDRRALSPDDDYERALVLADVEELLFLFERARAPQRNCMATAAELSPGMYVLRPYAPAEVRARALARHARELPRALAEIRGLLETPLPRPHAEVCAAVYAGLATFLEKDARAAFADVKDAAALAELDAALGPAVRAVQEQARWFRDRIPAATGSYALGRPLYEDMIRSTEGLDLDVAQLQAIGGRDLEANTAALREACARYAPGAELHACVDRMLAHKPGAATLAAAVAQLPGLMRFVQQRGLVNIPDAEQPRVEDTPSYARWNSASIDIPGPYDRGVPAIYYITPPDPSWSRAEQEAYVPSTGVLLLTSIHEVWPGHYLQFQWSKRARWPLARVLRSYAFTEGWAHYCEQMMWDAGYGSGDPEVRVAQLQDALLRDVRFLSSIGLHTSGMTVEESERMFRERAFQDPANARQQAVRGTFDPGYLNYTLGKLEIMRLRDAWTASRGGRAAWGAFHDALLALGAPRLGLARAKLMGEPLP